MMHWRALFSITVALTVCTPFSVNAESFLDEGIVKSESRYGSEPTLTEVTCYTEPGPTCTGTTKMNNLIASKPEYIGRVAAMYKVSENGNLGDFLGYYECLDVGYGKNAHNGTSSIFKGRKHGGTIESGLCVDVRQPTTSGCKQFMADTFVGDTSSTGSAVYIVLINGEG